MSGQLRPLQGKPHLLIHNCREFAEHVLIMRPQFFLVLQLVLLDEALIHVQGLPTRICKLPSVTAISNLTSSHRKWQLKVRLLTHYPTQKGAGQAVFWGAHDSLSQRAQGRTFPLRDAYLKISFKSFTWLSGYFFALVSSRKARA